MSKFNKKYNKERIPIVSILQHIIHAFYIPFRKVIAARGKIRTVEHGDLERLAVGEREYSDPLILRF